MGMDNFDRERGGGAVNARGSRCFHYHSSPFFDSFMPEIAAFKDVPSDKEALSSIRDRPFAARCCQSCCLHTYNKLDASLANRPLRDILRLDKIYKKQNFILRNICLMYEL